MGAQGARGHVGARGPRTRRWTRASPGRIKHYQTHRTAPPSCRPLCCRPEDRLQVPGRGWCTGSRGSGTGSRWGPGAARAHRPPSRGLGSLPPRLRDAQWATCCPGHARTRTAVLLAASRLCQPPLERPSLGQGGHRPLTIASLPPTWGCPQGLGPCGHRAPRNYKGRSPSEETGVLEESGD